ncbi:glycosyltransferase family 4 protein [Zwartia sp.]|uniref:glycosyltransferase family 4 protein n=1 Tax=Zwartia sp. TaxID=2978004 RepID=UPI00271BA8D5|nr:glycosyltransferase family 4 protein [Zwartia sp.]MDO9024043.1 glycosyltransferase family 4 protein [Zwartia sp.]
MRILQLNLEKGWRGGERQTLLTALAQRSQGHEVEVVARDGSELASRAQAEGLTVHYARQAVSLTAWLAIHGSRFDVIHAQTAGSITGAVLAKPFHRRPIVFSRRTNFPVTSGAALTRFKWRHVDQLVAISQAAAVEPRRFGIEPVIIPSAIAPIESNPVRVDDFLRQYKLEGKTLIGTCAALTSEKDPLILIRAAALVCAKFPDTVFIHWGGPGPLSEAANNLIAELKLQEHYLLVGFQKEPEQLFPALTLFVLASRFEALGSSILDAMLQGVPVIGTRTGGIQELLAKGRGILTPVGDAASMAQHIEWALSHPEQARQMALLAHQHVTSEHEVTHMAQKYLTVYEGLVDNAR